MKRVKLSSEQVKDNSTIRMKISILTSIQYNDMKQSSIPRNLLGMIKALKLHMGKNVHIF